MSEPAAESKKTRKSAYKQNPRRWWIELLVIIAVVVGLALLGQAYVVKPFRIPSGSMEPTLKIGQRVLVDRLFSSPSVGDIVVFHPPNGADTHNDTVPPQCGVEPPAGAMCPQGTKDEFDEYYVKRIVAGPGDRIKLVNGVLYRNGKAVKEKYAQPCTFASRCNFPRAITVPKDQYFMMGDNRSYSADSRFWGPVPKDWIVGNAFATYWPPDRIGGV